MGLSKTRRKSSVLVNKVLPLFLCLSMVVSLCPGLVALAYADEQAQTITGAGPHCIDQGGTYEVAADASGEIVVSTTDEVVLVGGGVSWDSSYVISSSTVKHNLFIDASETPGANITLKDIYIENPTGSDTQPMIDFSGEGNVLNIEGTVLLEKLGAGQGTYACVHVAKGSELTVGGSGTLYMYKYSGGSGFGGSKNELNGDITFGTDDSSLTVFAKGSKQGALIGAGTGGSSDTDEPGAVNFVQGEYNLISNSRGAVIGGAAASITEGGASSGTSVTVGPKANININCDYSGSAVGGAGYNGANDASGGTLTITGGSLRTYLDTNAVKNTTWKAWNGSTIAAGVNDAAITAQRLNANGDAVYMSAFDTTLLSKSASTFTVYLDADKNVYYQGGLPRYGFVQEGLDKSEQLSISSTPSNWYANGETHLYLWLTGADHVVKVNGESFTATWDASSKSFSYAPVASTYAVSTAITGNAANSLSADKATAAAGETVTLSPVAASGYYLAQVRYASVPVEGEDASDTVNGGLTYTVIAPDAQGKYSFTMPEGAVKVVADFVSIVWDGTVDVTWYDPEATTYNIYYPAQFAGVAAVMNGLFTTYPTKLITPASGSAYDLADYDAFKAGMGVKAEGGSAFYGEFTQTYTLFDTQNGRVPTLSDAQQITKTTRVIGNPDYIVLNCSTGGTTGANNQVTTADYFFGIEDYKGKTINVMVDLDFGASKTDGKWNLDSPLYMTLGGQATVIPLTIGSGSSMTSNGYNKIGTSFNGVLDGNGHKFTNVFCEHYTYGGNFGDSQAVGLVGRLGTHDNDPAELAAVNPTVRRIILESGYVSGRRSVGGIVGKIGQTTASKLNDGSIGGIIEYCVNKADVFNTDSKGIGGICGASWNKGVVRYCANFGNIFTTYSCPAGGVVGSNEVPVICCYSVGDIKTSTANNASYAMGIGTNNGGVYTVTNCYWLLGSAMSDSNKSSFYWGGYYSKTYKKYNGNTQEYIIPGTANNGTYNFGAAAGITAGTISILPDFVETATSGASTALTAARLNNAASKATIWVDDATGINAKDGISYPVLYFQAAGYQPTEYSVTLTQTAGGTISATAVSGQIGDGYVLSNTPELGYILDHYEINGVATTEAAQVISGNANVTGVFRQLRTYTLSLPDTSDEDFTLSLVKSGIIYEQGNPVVVSDYALSNGDTIYETDVISTTYAVKAGAAPADVNKEYTGNMQIAYKSGDSILFQGNVNPLKYTVMGSESTEEHISLAAVNITTANKKWSTLADTSWIDIDKPAAEYTITTPQQFAGIAEILNKTVFSFEGVTIKLGNDISMLNPDGTDSVRYWVYGSRSFKGTLDGQGHSVSGLSMTGYGLFQKTENAIIKNLTLEGSCVSNNGQNGFVANANSTVFENCINKVAITDTYTYGTGSGGFAAKATKCSFKNCANYADITAAAYPAGIVGQVASGCSFENCRNYGKISSTGTGSNAYAAGLVGKTDSGKCTFDNCCNEGVITASGIYAAGLVSYAYSNAVFNNCCNLAAISSTNASGQAYAAGFVAYLNMVNSDYIANFKDCYNAGDLSAVSSNAKAGAAGFVGICNNSGIALENCYNAGAASGKNAASVLAYKNVTSANASKVSYAGSNSYYISSKAAVGTLDAPFALTAVADADLAQLCANLNNAENGGDNAYAQGSGVLPILQWQLVPVPAIIKAQPQAVSIKVGESAEFSVSAVHAVSYEWRYQLPGKTVWSKTSKNTATIELVAAAWMNGTNWACWITGEDGSVVKSDAALFTVAPKAQAANLLISGSYESILANSTASFAIDGDIPEGSSYAWRYQLPGKSWSNVCRTTASFDITAASWMNGTKWACWVTSPDGITVKSDDVTMSFRAKVAPANLAISGSYESILVNSTASFEIGGDIPEGSTYVWRYQLPGSSSWSAICRTTASFDITAASWMAGTKWACWVSSPDGITVKSDDVTMSFRAKVAPANLAISGTYESILVNSTASFEIGGDIPEGSTYAWRYQLPGKAWSNVCRTTASFDITAASWMNGAKWACWVTSPDGVTVKSDDVTMSFRAKVAPANLAISGNYENLLSNSTASFAIGGDIPEGSIFAWRYQLPGKAWSNVCRSTASFDFAAAKWMDGSRWACWVTSADGVTVKASEVTLTFSK